MAAEQTLEQMKAEIEKLKAERDALVQKNASGISLKVSEKGGINVIGMRRFPFFFYRQEWEVLKANAARIDAFIAANSTKLSSGKPTV
jgi:hypothetical protein